MMFLQGFASKFFTDIVLSPYNLSIIQTLVPCLITIQDGAGLEILLLENHSYSIIYYFYFATLHICLNDIKVYKD